MPPTFTYVGKAIAYILAVPETLDNADNKLTRGFGTKAPEDRSRFVRCFGTRWRRGTDRARVVAVAIPDPRSLGRLAHTGVEVVVPVPRC